MKTYKYKVQGVDYEVEITEVEGKIARVNVNGIPFEIEMQKPINAAKHPALASKAQPAVVAPAAEKRVFVLDDEDLLTAPVVQQAAPAAHEEFKTEIDTMVEDIHIVQPEAEVAEVPEDPIAVFAPISQPKQETGRSAFENDNDVATAADRIRRIHELLRSNPNGADIVQQMATSQIRSEPLYEGQHSATREASAFSMRADGTVAKNAYLYGNQPD